MKSVQDALYNWLTIKVIYEGRPSDEAAKETYEMFDSILKEDHQVSNVKIEKMEDFYLITFTQSEKERTTRFPIEMIDCFLEQVKVNPEKY
ncbi:hypothetical protein RAH41_16165 [Gottfriedia acidiceleris]|uniref:hypothetical protein n=1 Tax=Gottfriedia acidiceleris TaxID=371036 RepID=UPI002F26B461